MTSAAIQTDRPSPLRVTHVASGDLWAGAEAQICHLLLALRAADPGNVIEAILFNDGELAGRLRHGGIGVTVLDESRLGPVSLLRQLRTCLREHAPDVVHTHGYKQNILATVALASLGRFNSVRTVHGSSEFGIPAWHLPKRAVRSLDALLGRWVQKRTIAVSDALHASLRSQGGDERVTMIENGVAIDEVLSLAAQPVDLPGRADTFRVALVGRMVPVKRVDLFLRLAHEVIARNEIKCEFYVFGDGQLQDEMLELAESLGLQSAVHFMGFRANVLPYLKLMNTLVIVSDHEGLPMTLLEAMCLRVPVISHAVGGIPRVLDGGRAGVLVATQDVSKFADAVVGLGRDPSAAAGYAERAFDRVRSRYSVQRVATETEALYRQCCERVLQ